MKLSARYKVIGKKRFAKLGMPYEEVLDTFENAIANLPEDSRLVGSVNRETGVFKIEYKLDPNKKDTFETYCILVQVKDKGDETTKIEYAFVYDRFISWYTRILSAVCFAVPLGAASLAYFYFKMQEMVHLTLYAPLLLISAFGLFSLLAYNEKKEAVQPMVKDFEQLLISTFDE